MHLAPQTLAELLDSLRHELPPVFARVAVPRLLGGIIAVGSLANLDSASAGPPGSFRHGRRVCYKRDPFLAWLGTRLTRA